MSWLSLSQYLLFPRFSNVWLKWTDLQLVKPLKSCCSWRYLSFLCYIKRDYHRNLKKKKSVRQRSRWAQLYSLLRVSQGWTELLSEVSGEVHTSMLVTVLGRIRFPSCPCSVSLLSQQGRASLGLSDLQEALWLLLPQVGKNTLVLKGLRDLTRPTKIISFAM